MTRRFILAAQAVALLLLLVSALSGCGDTASSSGRTSNTEPQRQIVNVREEDYGDAWPFTVSRGQVELIGSCVAVFHSGGVTYALNGMARAKKYGYADIYSIWRDQPFGYGKINIGPMIDLALSLYNQ
jgi:hypothetical protein